MIIEHYGVHRDQVERDLASICFGLLPRDITAQVDRAQFSFLECEPLEILLSFMYTCSPTYSQIQIIGASINGLMGRGLTQSRSHENHNIDQMFDPGLIKLPSPRTVERHWIKPPAPERNHAGPIENHDNLEVSKAFEETWAGLLLLSMRWLDGYYRHYALVMDTTDRAAFIRKYGKDPDLIDDDDPLYELSELSERAFMQFKSSGHDGSGNHPVHDGTLYGTSEFVASIVLFDLDLKFPLFAREYRYTALERRAQELMSWAAELGLEPNVILADRAFSADGKIWNILNEFCIGKKTWIVMVRKSPTRSANNRLLRKTWRNLVLMPNEQRNEWMVPASWRVRKQSRNGKINWVTQRAPSSYWHLEEQGFWGQARFNSFLIPYFEAVQNPKKTRNGRWVAHRGTIVQTPLDGRGNKRTCYTGLVLITNKRPTSARHEEGTIALIVSWLRRRWNIENLFKQVDAHFGRNEASAVFPRQATYYQALTAIGCHALWKGAKAVQKGKIRDRDPDTKDRKLEIQRYNRLVWNQIRRSNPRGSASLLAKREP